MECVLTKSLVDDREDKVYKHQQQCQMRSGFRAPD